MLGFDGRQRRAGRPAGSPGVPRLPRPPPGDRAPDRPQAVREVRQRRPVRRARRAPGPRLPGQRHRRSSRCCARSSPPASSAARSARRCATPARTSSRRTALLRVGLERSRPTTTPRPTPSSGRPPDSAARRSPGPDPTASRSNNEAWSSPSRMLASMQAHLRHVGRLVADGRDQLPHAEGLGAPGCPIRFDTLVDHLSQAILHKRSTAALLEACCNAIGLPARGRDHHPGPRGHPVGLPAPADHVPRLPRLLPPVTAMTQSRNPTRLPASVRRPLLPRVRRRHPARLLFGAVALAGTTTIIGSAVVRASAAAPVPARAVTGRPLPARCRRRALPGRAARRPGVLPGPAPRIAIPPTGCWSRTTASACTRRSRPCSRCGTTASWPPSTRPGSRSPTGPTSRRWRRSRTPTLAPTPGSAGSTG